MPRCRFDDRGAHADLRPRPVMAVGTDIVAGPGGRELVAHRHPMAQMIYTARGVLTCAVARSLWIVPPGCAVRIPGDTQHLVKRVGTLEASSLFVDLVAAPGLPDACCTVSVSPLLHELLLRCVDFAVPYPAGGPESRRATVLLDELAAAPVQKTHLPMPTDDRLRTIADSMAAEPSDRASVREWAGRIGLSERTLSRLVQREIGMSFGRWRQQFHISLALQWLSRGMPVRSVAADLGYESASSFVFMFRKVLGTSSARYMTLKQAGGDKGLSR